MVNTLTPDEQPQPHQTINTRRPSDRVVRRRRQFVAAGLATVLGAGVGLSALSNKISEETRKGGGIPNEVPYTARPGDRIWDIAEKIEANEDGKAGNKDVRPIAHDLQGQLHDGTLHAGDTLMVPESADLQPDQPGAQLTREDI